MSLTKTYRSISFRIVVIYALASILWIFLSDTLLFHYFPEGKTISISKGFIYVGLSALLLLYLLKQLWGTQNNLLLKDFKDELTGLENRSSLQTNLNNFLSNKEPFHLLFIDFDRFKMINDLYGHESGDYVLKQVANRLRYNVNIKSSDIIARWVADEFIVLLKNRSNEELEALINIILADCSIPLHIQEKDITIPVSIGSVHFPSDSQNPSELIRFAEIAVEEAKKLGGFMHQRYQTSLSELANRQLFLEDGLKDALVKNELFLHFQPQVLSSLNQMVGVESLLRWKHNDEMISPSEFIPIAERSGLIIKIGDFVLRETCLHIPIIEQALERELLFSVNVSARQFYQHDYIERTKQILQETNVNPNKIVLEITESIIMEYTEFVIKSLQELKDLGFQIAIDDFGTGYSSFKHLEKLPVNIIKIDQSFTRSIHNVKTKAIVQSIISLAHNLKLTVLAEGVEDNQQAISLKELECHYLQGYYFGKPLSIEQLLSIYQKQL